jgi:NMD protein affecting ribosome stability and mRNA decay
VMLPVCIYCGATCEDIEDEMCQKCWHKPEVPNIRS